MIITQHSNTAQIRKQLNLAFDDSALNAFCFDYFPEVYDKFSAGMRKDDKITLLLDYCRRLPNGLDRLEALLGHVCKEDRLGHFQCEQVELFMSLVFPLGRELVIEAIASNIIINPSIQFLHKKIEFLFLFRLYDDVGLPQKESKIGTKAVEKSIKKTLDISTLELTAPLDNNSMPLVLVLPFGVELISKAIASIFDGLIVGLSQGGSKVRTEIVGEGYKKKSEKLPK